MSCSFDKSIISRFARGKIEPLEKVFLEEHIKNCSECKSYLENEQIIAKSEKKSSRKKDPIIKETEKSIKKVSSFDKSANIAGIAGALSIVGVIASGATVWLRIVPFREITRNIFKKR